MRYLSKIVFINSAHIPYGEVCLDGNVHFVGTQGVGKSTILRAILFFYNADTTHLGIPREKKSFAEFYFPYPNSYIIYEVTRDDTQYFVILFQSRGRLCYRFVDTAYRMEYFIGPTGEVPSEFSQIRSRIPQGVRISRIVDSYGEFRDILYGNRQNLRGDVRGYCICESSRYQNIPRTIQNVFLNSRLDAEFIKSTIVSSLLEDEPGIDLSYYRHQIASFEQEYADISIWFDKDSSGKVPVRETMNRTTELYARYKGLHDTQESICGQTMYALERSRKALPSKKQALQSVEEKIERDNRLLAEEKGKYEKDRDSLQQEIGVIKDKLRSIKEKREHYAAIGIESILSLVSQEESLKIELKGRNSLLESLTGRYHSVTEKYDSLCKGVEMDLREFENEQKAQMTKAREFKVAEDSKVDAAFSESSMKAHSRYDAILDEIDSQKEQLAQDMSNLLAQREKVALESPSKDKLDTLSVNLAAYEKQQQEYTHIAQLCIEKLKAERSSCDSEEKGMKAALEEELSPLRQRVSFLEDRVKEIDSRLSNVDGSLLKWLEVNHPGWEENIGLVADDDILYNTTLSPSPSRDGGNSLFGVDISLDSIKKSVGTPQELRRRKSAFLSEIESLEKEEILLSQKTNEKINEMLSRSAREQKDLKEQSIHNEAMASTMPQKIQALKVEIDTLLRKDEQWRKDTVSQIDEKLRELSAEKTSLDERKKKALSKRDSEISAARKEADSRKDILQKSLQKRLSSFDEAILRKKDDAQKEIEKYRQMEKKELSGLGADSDAIDKIRREIDSFNDKLRRIDDARQTYYGYLSDKENLLDREDEFKKGKKDKDEKMESLTEHYDRRRNRLQESRDEKIAKKDALSKEIEMLLDGIEKVEVFLSDDNPRRPAGMADAKPVKVDASCQTLLENLSRNIDSIRSTKDSLRKSCDTFKGYFSEKNTFNFKTNLLSDDDYLAFADSLTEFEHFNKIEDYRQRVSDRYAEILQRISREVGDMTSRSGEVESTIREINSDFQENNFTGVIKNISLRKVDSDDTLMKLLVAIKEFADENTYSMGDVNLFSQDEQKDSSSRKIVDFLSKLSRHLASNQALESLRLGDTFRIQFKIVENDNDTGWIEKISNVGSDGTDVLVKAMVNIMLLNVFKTKASKKFGDFRLHCMMDEIGRLHPANVKGILQFAGARNIVLVNSSPMPYSVSDYKYTYLMEKDSSSNTRIRKLLTRMQ